MAAACTRGGLRQWRQTLKGRLFLAHLFLLTRETMMMITTTAIERVSGYLWIYTKRYCPPWMGKWEYCLNWWQVWSNSIGSVFTNEQISILNWVSKPRRGNNLSTDQVCPVLMPPMVGQMMQINGKSKIKPMMLGDQAEGVQIDDSWQQRDLFLKFE